MIDRVVCCHINDKCEHYLETNSITTTIARVRHRRARRHRWQNAHTGAVTVLLYTEEKWIPVWLRALLTSYLRYRLLRLLIQHHRPHLILHFLKFWCFDDNGDGVLAR